MSIVQYKKIHSSHWIAFLKTVSKIIKEKRPYPTTIKSVKFCLEVVPLYVYMSGKYEGQYSTELLQEIYNVLYNS